MTAGTTVSEMFGALPEQNALPRPASASAALTNLHIHLPPNFGAIASVDDAIAKAKDENIVALCASNYYDHAIYRPFARAAAAGVRGGMLATEARPARSTATTSGRVSK